MISKVFKYLPIKIHVIYILISLSISLYGPRIFIGYNKDITFVYMICYLTLVYIGFRLGFKLGLKRSKFVRSKDKPFKIFIKFLRISLVLFSINLIYLILANRLTFNIALMGLNYNDYYSYYNDKTSSSLLTFENIFITLSAIPKFVTTVMGFYYYNHSKRIHKIYFIIFLVLVFLTQTIAIGNQKSLGDIVIFGLVIFLIKSISYTRKRRKRIIVKMMIVVAGIVILFSYAQYSRLKSRGITLMDINDHYVGLYKYDLDHSVFKVFGPTLGLGIAQLSTGYLAGGYHGLSKSLELPFEWSYGVGSSVGLSNIFSKLFNIDPYSKTYLYRVEQKYGIDGKQRWHTIFPWLASDFGFIGALIILFLVAFYYGKCWREILLYRNPISILLFSLLTILFMFVPANNQIIHGFDYLTITSFIILLWRTRHKYYNY